MNNHIHNWELVEYDNGSRPMPKMTGWSLYDIMATIDDYQNSPRVEYKKWVCNCGKDRTYTNVLPSVSDFFKPRTK